MSTGSSGKLPMPMSLSGFSHLYLQSECKQKVQRSTELTPKS
jgi:hypothetical protein